MSYNIRNLLVYGFIRHHANIPDVICSICFKYYTDMIDEYFSSVGPYISTKKLQTIISKISPGWKGYNTAFGMFEIKKNTVCICEWIFKILKSYNGIIIGIMNSKNKHSVNQDFSCVSNSYAFGDDGYKYSNGIGSDYGKPFHSGDIVAMKLRFDDSHNGSLSFSIKNTMQEQTAFYVSSTYNFCMAVALCKKDDCVQLLSCQLNAIVNV
eukprot:401109_1